MIDLIYKEDTPTKEGLYLGLFHGRNNPNQKMNDWGFNGPLFGPLEWVQTTYGNLVRAEFIDPADTPNNKALLNGPTTLWIHVIDGCLMIDNKHYGDWSVFYHKAT